MENTKGFFIKCEKTGESLLLQGPVIIWEEGAELKDSFICRADLLFKHLQDNTQIRSLTIKEIEEIEKEHPRKILEGGEGIVASQFKLFINRLFRQLNRVIGKGWKPKTICELSVGYRPKIKKAPNMGPLDLKYLFEGVTKLYQFNGDSPKNNSAAL